MKRFTGTVVKTNNLKTAHVQIRTEWLHPKYLKKVHRSNVFACHDVVGANVGDIVEIIECKPMSATKFFTVDTIVKKSEAVIDVKPAVVKKKSVVKAKTKK